METVSGEGERKREGGKRAEKERERERERQGGAKFSRCYSTSAYDDKGKH